MDREMVKIESVSNVQTSDPVWDRSKMVKTMVNGDCESRPMGTDCPLCTDQGIHLSTFYVHLYEVHSPETVCVHQIVD
jgi:hypothetical protein